LLFEDPLFRRQNFTLLSTFEVNNLTMKISLVGYMGSGKSVLGKALAETLNLPFLDLDQLIEKQTGYTVAETIFNKGELFFRKLERQTLNKVLEREQFVLATGGGTPCYYDNMDQLNQNSLTVYLNMTVAQLFERLKDHQQERPLIAHLKEDALKEFIAKHLFERQAFYQQATFVLPTQVAQVEARLQHLKNILT